MRALFILFVVVFLMEIVFGEDVLDNGDYLTDGINGDKEIEHYNYVAMDFGSAGLIISMLLISVCVNMSFCCLVMTGTLTWKRAYDYEI